MDRWFVRNELLFSSIDYAVKSYQVTYLYDVLGTGKTTAVRNWLEGCGKRSICIEAGGIETFLLELSEIRPQEQDIVFIDSLQKLKGEEKPLKALARKIESTSKGVKYILTSRAALPKQLMQLELHGKVALIGKNEIRFDTQEVMEYLSKRNIVLEQDAIELVTERTLGNIMALKYFCTCLERGEEFSEDLLRRNADDFFDYFEIEFQQYFTPEIENFLYLTVPLEEFNTDLLQYLFPDGSWSNIIEQMDAFGSFLLKTKCDTYAILPIFRRFLAKKRQANMSQQQIDESNEKLGRYYEERNRLSEAMQFYYEADMHDKVRELLILNTHRNHTGTVQYYEMEKYYLMLSQEEIQENTFLMGALSMLYSLRGEWERSESYAAMIDAQLSQASPKSPKYYELLNQKLYLCVALPHRGNIQVVKTIAMGARLVTAGKMQEIPRMCVTGTLPSIMNGGKDFCSWSRHDELLYNFLGEPLRLFLGSYTRALPELALGESFYEKGREKEAFTKIVQGIAKADADKSMELYFAGQAVMVKILYMRGESETAQTVLRTLRARIIAENANHLITNLQAFAIRQMLNTGFRLEMEHWLNDVAPNIITRFWVTDRYQLLVKVRIYIMKRRFSEALMILERLEQYARDYDRAYILIEVWLLKSIILFQNDDGDYRLFLDQVLKKAESYHFIRLIADEGTVVWDMLQEETPVSDYQRELFEAVKRQAALYPGYLREQQRYTFRMTEGEKNILKLLVRGMKNEEIAKVLRVSVNTVKYHLRNIYDKLGVNSRAMAINMMNERGFN